LEPRSAAVAFDQEADFLYFPLAVCLVYAVHAAPSSKTFFPISMMSLLVQRRSAFAGGRSLFDGDADARTTLRLCGFSTVL
jgi:hypothetical protein